MRNVQIVFQKYEAFLSAIVIQHADFEIFTIYLASLNLKIYFLEPEVGRKRRKNFLFLSQSPTSTNRRKKTYFWLTSGFNNTILIYENKTKQSLKLLETASDSRENVTNFNKINVNIAVIKRTGKRHSCFFRVLKIRNVLLLNYETIPTIFG